MSEVVASQRSSWAVRYAMHKEMHQELEIQLRSRRRENVSDALSRFPTPVAKGSLRS
ncbi:hypothetical protein P4S72_23240 [Vibrio sp. PP-XX7]